MMSRDVVVGVLLLAASTWYYYTATQLPVSLIDTTVNSSVLPKLLGIGGMGLSVILIGQGLVRQWRTVSAAAEAGAEGPSAWVQHTRAAGVVAIAIGYVLLLIVFGYVIAIGLAIAAMAIYQGAYYGMRQSWRKIAAVAIVGATSFWLIFDKLLGIRMPVGLIWRTIF